MDLERQTLCRKLVTFLYSACPKLVLALKATPQVYPGSTSDFHMEDSVWTHTMLVLQAALERTDFGLEDIATALVHDFAKPLTARVKEAKVGQGYRMSFAGHGPLGVQPAVDFCLAARKAGILPLTNEEIARIASATSNHIAFYNLPDSKSALSFCNNDAAALRTLVRLMYCDMQGSIADTQGKAFLGNLEILRVAEELLAGQAPAEQGPVSEGPGLHLVCGTKGRAKEVQTMLLANGRATIWLEDTGALENSGPSEGFAELAFRIQEQSARTREEGVLICADLCTRSARKSLCSLLKRALPDIPITCTLVLSPMNEWYPSEPEPLHKGLPKKTPNLVVPSLAFEEHLARACVVLAEDVRDPGSFLGSDCS